MEDYSAKLTGEPFLYNETKILAEYLLKGETPENLKKRNIEENLIMHKKTGSIKRTNSPIFRRLSGMDNELLYEFVNSDIQTSKMILLYSIMKTDKLVKDFIFEIYQNKLYMREDYIERFDIDNWFEEKKSKSKCLRERTEATIEKLKQVIMKILQDSNLVQKEKDPNNKLQYRFKIIKPILSNIFINLVTNNGDYDYAKAIGGLV